MAHVVVALSLEAEWQVVRYAPLPRRLRIRRREAAAMPLELPASEVVAHSHWPLPLRALRGCGHHGERRFRRNDVRQRDCACRGERHLRGGVRRAMRVRDAAPLCLPVRARARLRP